MTTQIESGIVIGGGIEVSSHSLMLGLPNTTLPITFLAQGLQFPEGPVIMNDGSLLFVQIESKQVSRLKPDGTVELVAQLDGGPNGLAIGPDGALYVANDGGRFTFKVAGDPPYNYPFPDPLPSTFIGGSIQRIDLMTNEVTTLYTECNGVPLGAPNDLVFDKFGGMYISNYGTTDTDGSIYYADINGQSITVVKSDMYQPNGIGLSPDGSKLHSSGAQQLLTFNIASPGVFGPDTEYTNGVQGTLPEGAISDSLKVLEDGRVCVCTLLVPGISIFDEFGNNEFIEFIDPMTTNIVFGGSDMRQTWITSSGTSEIIGTVWPYTGLKLNYYA